MPQPPEGVETAGNAYGLPPGFEFVRLLGRGANGTVVLARQLSLARLVAVKIIHTMASAAAVERLRREARVLAGLNHQHILPVYQLQESAGSLALVMKFEPWGDLEAALPGLTGHQRVGVLRDVASALDAAHGRGIVHRDLKPANVLSDEYGRAVLADFGLARLPRGADGFRTVGTTVTGTPLYLAPEQIRDPGLEAPSVDHYAYGILAYRLLAGRWPYADPTWSSVTRLHLEAVPVPPREVVPGLDPAVAAAMTGLLDKDPVRRLRPADLVDRLAAVAPETWDALIPGHARADPAAAQVTQGATTAFGFSGPDAEPVPARAVTRTPSPAPQPEPADHLAAAPWVAPPVYRPARRRRLALRLAVVGLGLLVGAGAYWLWLLT